MTAFITSCLWSTVFTCRTSDVCAPFPRQYLDRTSPIVTISFVSRNCFQNYLDFYRCINIRGEDYEPCQYFKKSFTTICPMNWVEKWDEQREAGTFPADLTK